MHPDRSRLNPQTDPTRPAAGGSKSSLVDTATEVCTLAQLADLLRQLRRRHARQRRDSPLTYRELAAKSGWAPATIGMYLTGRVLPPSDRLDVLATLLGATQTELGALGTARDRVEDGRRPSAPVEATGRVPRRLPADIGGFIGRTGELVRLDGVLRRHREQPAGTVAVVSGTAGVGKTALAIHWAHRVAGAFPDGRLYLDLCGFDPAESPVPPAVAMRDILDAFEVPEERIPADATGQSTVYRSLLSGKRVLLLLDNARDAEQVRPLLPAAPGCLVLVTSRNQLTGLVATEGAHPIELGVLTLDEARQMLASRLGADRVAAEPQAVDAVIGFTARLPLALTTVAARAATHPDFPFASFATQLRDGRLDALDTGEARTDIRSVFASSYHLLSPAAARLFRVLALGPGPDLSEPAAASLAGLPLRQVRPLLHELARAHLIEEQAPGRYTQHGLLRAYGADLATGCDSHEPPRAAQPLRARIAGSGMRPAATSPDDVTGY